MSDPRLPRCRIHSYPHTHNFFLIPVVLSFCYLGFHCVLDFWGGGSVFLPCSSCPIISMLLSPHLPTIDPPLDPSPLPLRFGLPYDPVSLVFLCRFGMLAVGRSSGCLCLYFSLFSVYLSLPPVYVSLFGWFVFFSCLVGLSIRWVCILYMYWSMETFCSLGSVSLVSML